MKPFRLTPLAFAVATAFVASEALALPTGADIRGGQGAVSSPNAGSVVVRQDSARLAIDWQSFGIAAGESVRFLQPGASSIALNRVLGNSRSEIFGNLTANGQVFLLNANGVLFGRGAQVDVGGLVASTLDISPADFMAGKTTFSGSNGGAVVNQGRLSAASGGYVALLGPVVRNEGVIEARMGTVALAAGDQVTLNFGGNSLVGLSVDRGVVGALVENHQLIRADGGRVLLSARAADDVVRAVVNNTGVIEANTVSNVNGLIRLEGLGASTVTSSGTLTARGDEAGATGGTVQMLGERVGLMSGGQIDASGSAGGGVVLVGGEWQGKNPDIQNAFRTYVAPDASIRADAILNGDGGKIVVWSDDATRFYGAISARGGASGGNGGAVEISGKGYLDFDGTVNTSAAFGRYGMLLLDPTNIEVISGGGAALANVDNATLDVNLIPSCASFGGAGCSQIDPSTINGAGANVTLAATNNILFTNAISLTNPGVGLTATTTSGNITVNANITTANVSLVDAAGDQTAVTGSIALSAGASVTGTGRLITGNAAITGATATGTDSATSGSISVTAGTGGVSGGIRLSGTNALTIGTATTATGVDFATTGSIALASRDEINNGTASTALQFSLPLPSGPSGVFGKLAVNTSTVAGSAYLTTAGPLTMDTSNVTGSLQITTSNAAAGTISLGSTTVAGNLKISAAESLSLGSTTVTGDLQASAGGSVAQTGGGLQIGGTTSVSAGGQIYLNTCCSNFTGAVTLSSSNDIAITATGLDPLILNPISNAHSIGIESDNSEIRLSGNYSTSTADFAGGAITVFGNNVSHIVITGATALDTSASPNGGNIQFFNSDIVGSGALTLKGAAGGIAFNSTTIGQALALGALTVDAAPNTGGLSLPSTRLTSNLQITNGGWVTQTGGGLQIGGTTSVSAGGQIYLNTCCSNFTGAVTLSSSNDIAITATGLDPLILNPISNAHSIGIESDNSEIRLSGNYSTSTADFAGGAITVFGNNVSHIVITGATALDTSASPNGGNIQFFNSDIVGSGALTLKGAAGGIAFNSTTIGQALALGALTVDAAPNTGGLSLPSTRLTSNLQITNGGWVTQTGGGLQIGGTTSVSAGGQIYLNTCCSNFTGAVTLSSSNDIAITATGLDPLILNPISNAHSIGIESDNSEIRLSGNYSTSTADFAGGAITVFGNNVSHIVITGATALDTSASPNGGNIQFFNSDIVGSGALTLKGAAGGIAFNSTTIGQALALGALTVDAAPNTGGLSLPATRLTGDLQITTGGAVAFADNVSAQTIAAAAQGGDVSIATGKSLTASGAGDAIVLAAGGNFVNNAGSSAISTPSGRWLVYSTSPAGSTESGLAALADPTIPRLYNRTYAANGPATITQAGNHLIYSSQPAVTVAANAVSRNYGDPNPVFTYSTSGTLVTDDGVTDPAFGVFTGALTSAAVPSSPVASSPFAITQGTLASSVGYGITYAGANLTVNQRPVTMTADAGQTKVYGNVDPGAFTFTSTSLGGGVALSGTLTRAAGETVGNYAIGQGTLTNANNLNYLLTYVGDNFSISQRPVTVTANAGQAKVYGNADPGAFTFTNTGLGAGVALAGALDRAAGENVGNYAIGQGTLTNANNPNYSLSFVSDNFGITQRPVTVTASAGQTKLYGNADPIFAYANSSLGAGLALAGALDRAAGENVGNYAIGQGTLTNASNPNYTLTFVPDNFGITQRPVTVTANAGQTKIYGNADPVLAFSSTSLGSGAALAGALDRAAGENVGGYAIGQGTLTNAGNPNYTLAFVPDTFGITPRPLMVVADNKSKIQGDPNPLLTASFSGFAPGESLANLGGTLLLATSAVTGSPEGRFAITPSGYSSGNYTISYVDGVLTITTSGVAEQVRVSIADADQHDNERRGGDHRRGPQSVYHLVDDGIRLPEGEH